MPNQLCFLDSNIWLYILMTDPRNTPEEEMRKRQIAIELTENENVLISTQVINEVCSILSRKAGFNENQIRQAIQEFYDGCVVVNINYETLITASNLRSRYNFSFWDGLQRICNNFDLLYSIPETIPKLRQAILQLAVQGKLDRQDPNDESSSILLKQVKADREQLIKEKKIPKEKPLPPLVESELPYELPDRWNWIRLGEIARLIEYGTSEKASDIGIGVPVLRMNNIRDGKLLFDSLKYVDPLIKDLPRLYLQSGDLLFNRTNSYELVGKTAIFRGNNNQYTFASYLIKVALFLDYVIPEFINLAMNSTYFRQTQIEPEITQQCGQANFNGTKLRNALIPLPPLAEQKRIVAKVDRLMSLCDELERQSSKRG